MRSNDMEAFRVYLAGIYSLYRTELSATIVELWWRALKPHNLSDAKEAIEAHIADGELGQYCPKPADVIRAIQAKTKPKSHLCWNCQGDLSALGSARLGAGYVCSRCYGDYLKGGFKAHEAAK